MTVVPYLRFAAKLKGMSRGDIEAAIDRIVDTCGLRSVTHRLLGHLSKGFRQRAGLAQALIHDPPVLILDEPTNGLDPGQIDDMLAFIKTVGTKRTIILSTHILDQVARIADKVVIINDGRIAVEGALATLTRERQLADVYKDAVLAGRVDDPAVLGA